MRPIAVWFDYIGQTHVTRTLDRLICGSRALGHVVAPVLFLGSSGLGKTTLAKAIGKAAGVPIHTYLAADTMNAEYITALRGTWAVGDVVFFDEIHNLSRTAQEALFTVLDSREITVIGATDRPGALVSAFKKRFPLMFDLEPFSVREMTAIVQQRAAEMKMLLTAQAAKELGQRCRGLPRVARHLLLNVCDFFGENPPQEFSTGHVVRCLKKLGIDTHGLGELDRRYIEVLRQQRGSRVPLRFVALRLCCDEKHLASDVEPYLVQMGLLGIDRQGRFLTEKGDSYAS